jgi:hypothetical protein
MLTDWIPSETLAALNDGFVVAIMLEAKEGEADALARIWAAHEATDHFKAAVRELLPRVTRRERVPFVPFV